MTSVFKLELGSTEVKVYDPTEVIEYYSKLGMEFDSLSNINYFTYASLPEGSHGKFLVEANAVRNLATSASVKLTVQGSVDNFVHNNLRIAGIEYIVAPLTGWTLIPSVAVHKQMAVITVEDFLIFDANDVIEKDYNRVTTYLPADTANTSEPIQGSLQTFDQILTDILTNYGNGASVDITGAPSVKPHNILTAGCSIPEVFSYIADCMCVTAYADAATTGSGKVVFTNVPSASELVQRQPYFTRYGSRTLPNDLIVMFGQQGHPFAKQRTEVLKDYYTNWSSEWATEEEALTANNDAVLANNARFKNSSLSESHYYPFYESGLFSQGDANTALISAQLATNYVAKTQRLQTVLYKDVADLNPSATVGRITFRILPEIGLVTQVEPCDLRSTKPTLKENQLARGLEQVPQMLVGTATLSASNALGGTAPGDTGLITLADLGAGSLEVPYYNATKQQTFEFDTIAVFYNIHTRRYEFVAPIEALFQYTLRTNWTNGVAAAFRKNIATGVSSGKTVAILDPLRIFDYQMSGDSGYMIHTKNDKFIAIQSPCNAEIPPDSSTPVGACCVGSFCFDDLTESGCTSVGGAWQGEGVACSSNPCAE